MYILAPVEQSTRRLAAILAADARPGDCICLHGDVGAGKSVFRCGPGLVPLQIHTAFPLHVQRAGCNLCKRCR